MLPLDQQVSSLECSKRLKELGCPQKSIFIYGHREDNVIRIFRKHYEESIGIIILYSAYTASELGQMLPDSIIGNKYVSECLTFDKWRNQWLCCYGDIDDKNYYPTLVEATAKMLIHLLENKLMEVPK